MKLYVALALALAPLRTDADGPPAKGGLRVFEGAPGDKNFLDASSRDAARKPRASRDASVDTRRARPTLLRRRLDARRPRSDGLGTSRARSARGPRGLRHFVAHLFDAAAGDEV